MPAPPTGSFISRHPLMVIRLAVAAVVLSVLGAAVAFAVIDSGRNKVLIDCGSVGGHVFIDGKEVGALEPGGHKVVPIKKGSHTIEAKGASGSVLEKATVSIPAKRFRGVFRFGGARPVVLVSEIYGTVPDAVGKATPVLETVPEGPFAALPERIDLNTLDTPFPVTIAMGEHEPYRVVLKICHVNDTRPGPAQVACSGAPIEEEDDP